MTIDCGLWTFFIFAFKLDISKLAKSVKLQGEIGIPQLHCIGIICSENILKLSWLLNRNLNFCLSQAGVLFEKDKEYSLFQYEDESSGKISLLKNKADSASYFPELKNIDYILFFSEQNEIKRLIQIIKNISEISSALSIDLNALKSKNKTVHFS